MNQPTVELREALKDIKLSVDLPDNVRVSPPDVEMTLGQLISARDIDEILKLFSSYLEKELKGLQKEVEGKMLFSQFGALQPTEHAFNNGLDEVIKLIKDRLK